MNERAKIAAWHRSVSNALDIYTGHMEEAIAQIRKCRPLGELALDCIDRDLTTIENCCANLRSLRANIKQIREDAFNRVVTEDTEA